MFQVSTRILVFTTLTLTVLQTVVLNNGCIAFPQDAEQIAALKKRRTFKKFTYRGVDLEQLLDMSYEQLMTLMHARARRRFSRGVFSSNSTVGRHILAHHIIMYSQNLCREDSLDVIEF